MVEPKLKEFYERMLSYAGLMANEDGMIIVQTGKKEPVKSEDGRIYYLPFRHHLKTPEGKKFFHTLNENHERPEAEAFTIYKENLLLEINSKLVFLMTTLIDLAAQPDLQKSIKSRKLIDILTKVGEAEPEMSKLLMEKITPKATRENGEGAFIDFFIRKNGEVDGVDFKVIAKVNFLLYKELVRALDEKGYKIYGQTTRKKDILTYINVLEAIFPNITKEVDYSVGTDNVVFGFTDALLKVSYIVSDRINEIVKLLIKDLGTETLNEILVDMRWVEMLEEVYGLTEMIRYIPNQDDVVQESSRKLKVDESSVKNVELQKPIQQQPQQPQVPTFNPQLSTPQPQVQQQPQVPQQSQQPQAARPSLESIVGSMGQQPTYQQPMLQPGLPPQQQMVAPVPMWLQQQMMQQQQVPMQQGHPQQMQRMQQPYQNQYPMMGVQQPMQQPYQNPYQNQYPMMGVQQPMQQGYPQPYQQPMMGSWQQGYGYGQPMRRDAFSQIEPSALNSGG